MPGKPLLREQIEALEKILGVSLPEGGFTMEIKPLSSGELDESQLDVVSGGIPGNPVRRVNASIHVNVVGNNWTAKV